MINRHVVTAGLCGVVALFLAGCGSEADDDTPVYDGAMRGCGADVGADGRAPVPPAAQGADYVPGGVDTTRGNLRVLCGDGTTGGAVHMQLSAPRTNFSEIITCAASAIERGVPTQLGTTVRYDWPFPGGTAAAVVDPAARTIESASVDSADPEAWGTCSVAGRRQPSRCPATLRASPAARAPRSGRCSGTASRRRRRG